MDLDIGWFRRSLWISLGLLACGPAESDSGSVDGDGDGDGTVGTSVGTTGASTTSVGTTGASTTVGTSDESGSTTTPTTWPDPPWCGLAPPDDATPPAECANPQPILQPGGEPSGFVQCNGGYMHRASVETCVYPAEVVGSCNLGGGTGSESGDFGECVTDADCDAAPHGYCNLGFFGDFCECNYGCETDADCGEGMVCGCFGADARCIPASCTSDAECGDYLCVLYGNQVACHGAFDTCHTGVDCPDGECPVCQYSTTNCAWACEPDAGTCTVGRPFLVDGASRLAAATTRDDWSAALACPPIELAAASRERLAEYWTEVALAEHASVSAFARFALQLAALGAPPRLLTDTAAAMADEIEHARLAFALARRYGGRDVGPSGLAMQGALAEGCDPVAIAVLAVREACIGETLAAIEAAAALQDARDPAVCGVLRTIAEDELRHAVLGWRFLAWVLTRVDDNGRARIRDAFARAIADAHAEVGDPVATSELHAHGILDGEARTELRRVALREVVAPVATSLCAAPQRVRAAA